MGYTIGVDIEGTKIAAVLMDEHGIGCIVTMIKSETGEKEKMFKQVISSIDKILKNEKISISEMDGIGVGVPGKVDRKMG